MARRLSFTVSVLLLALSGQRPPLSPRGVASVHAQLPLVFVPNRGQIDREVKFVARSPVLNAFLTAEGAVFALKPAGASRWFRMHLLGASARAELSGEGAQPGEVNELLGDDPSSWRTHLPTFAGVRYRGVYPGVDLVFHGDPQRLEYDFDVAPGADPRVIRVQFEGAEEVRVDASGDLLLSVGGRELRQCRPIVYERVGDGRREVGGAYVVTGSEVAFALGDHDPRNALVIDPVLNSSTYLGGSGFDFARAVATDGTGAAYFTGFAYSADFPLGGAYQGASGGGEDAFVAKVSSTGALVYATYLGGSADDEARAIAVDASGNAYVTGVTASTNFPVLNATQAANAGFGDAFITKLTSTGAALSYSTYLGGAANADDGSGIAVDGAGNAYVSGSTFSYNFPTTPGLPGSAGNSDAFLAKLSSTGARLWSRCLGGTGYDSSSAVGIDSAGNAYLVGSTSSTNFPTASAAQAAYGGGTDAWLTRINADAGVGYSTYFGGTSAELAFGVAVDGTGAAYLTGYTNSTNFPTQGPLQAANGGGHDAIVAKFLASGALAWSTYLGGAGADQGNGIAIDGAGNAYVAGYTASTDFPTLHPLQSVKGVGNDAFVVKVSPTGAALAYSTFLGGAGDDEGTAIAVDATGFVSLAGYTDSADFPTLAPAQAAHAGNGDAFLAKLDLAAPLLQSVTPAFGSTAGGTAVTLDGFQFAPGVTLTWGGASVPVTLVDAQTLTATAPAHAAGAVNVVVTNSDGRSSTLDGGYLYVAPPVVSSVSPSGGPAGGGAAVTLTGTAFAAGATVTFGGVPATNVVISSATTITATTPAHAAGAVTVVVTNPPDVTGGLANGYTYAPPPAVASVAPTHGPASGGRRSRSRGRASAAARRCRWEVRPPRASQWPVPPSSARSLPRTTRASSTWWCGTPTDRQEPSPRRSPTTPLRPWATRTRTSARPPAESRSPSASARTSWPAPRCGSMASLRRESP